MRIAYCCNNYFSPSETFVRDLSGGLSGIGHAVTVVADGVSDAGREMGRNVGDVVNLEIGQPSVLTRLAARIRSLKGGSLDGYISDARNRGYQRMAYDKIRGIRPDLIYADYGSKAVYLIDVARELNIPLIAHFHGYDLSSCLSSDWYRGKLEDLACLNHPMIVPSQHLRRMLEIAIGKVKRLEVVPYEPNLQVMKSLKDVQRLREPTVVALGRLTAKKNPLALLEAFRIVNKVVPNARLEWVGEGPQRARLEKRINQAGLTGQIKLHGALPHDQAMEVMARGWVFAQHSVTAPDGDQEGLPVAILEALALGLPVVSTIHSGIPEVVKEGVNGFLVREHDFESMAERIIDLLLGKLKLTGDQSDGRNVPLAGSRVRKIDSIFRGAMATADAMKL